MTVVCSGGCKQEVEDGVKAGWDFLHITGRFRCGACGLALAAAGAGGSTAEPTPVTVVDPKSRGALKELREMPPLKESPR